MRNRHVFVLPAVAAVAIVAAACSDSVTPPPARPGEPPSLELKPTETQAPENAGFDECGLVETDELAAVLRKDFFHLVPTGANGQPAAVTYERAADGRYVPHGIQVLTLTGDRIARITAFNDPGLVALFEVSPVPR
ncbi:hypothetical protein [Actinophytocola algeriensis]|uniref:Uncharacterized protein n=1 Tax=Actinophytocola algeriensis TaxID=1768010 RepID=A0A7W7QCI9_9PSEU|nr:hypothetical protein [Actinophytocola algeriensis]MBB4910998.1 hypothetical protein [Actinophytocola algeriensis]MBE1473991.1 hypothetical protein [Actinophytocola algeriensis]